MARRSRTKKHYPTQHFSRPRATIVLRPTPLGVRLLRLPQLVAPLNRQGRIPGPDKRHWHPDRWGVAALPRSAARLVVKPTPSRILTSKIAFADPKRVKLCHDRKTRKEVLHATGKAGGKVARPRRTPESNIGC